MRRRIEREGIEREEDSPQRRRGHREERREEVGMAGKRRSEAAVSVAQALQ